MDELQPRSNGWIFHSAGLMQSGSAENAAPPSLQPQNKACNYCYFPFIHLSILPTSGSIPHSPDSLHACLLLSALPSPSAPSVSSLHFPSPPSIPPQLCPSLPPSVPLLPLTSSVMSHLCGGSGEPLSLSFSFGRVISQSIITCVSPPPPWATYQSIRPWWRSAPLADRAAH